MFLNDWFNYHFFTDFLFPMQYRFVNASLHATNTPLHTEKRIMAKDLDDFLDTVYMHIEQPRELNYVYKLFKAKFSSVFAMVSYYSLRLVMQCLFVCL